MKTRAAYVFLATAFILIFAALPSAISQQSNWIVVERIIDYNTRADYTTKPVLTGGVYNFTFRVTVPFNAADDLVMRTPLNQSGSQYWYLKGAYSGVNLDTWTPARSTVSFKPVRGNATFSLIGIIPANITLRQANWDGNNIVLHFANETYPVVTLHLKSSGDRVGVLASRVEDQAIANYRLILQSKENLTKTANIETSYSVFLNSVINEAKEIYRKGFVAEASRVLNSIPSTVPLNPKPPAPPPPESPLPLILGGAFAVTLASTVLVAFFNLKARSHLGVVKNSVHEQAVKLDTSLVKLERLDKVLASEVEAVRSKLKDISA